MKIILNCTLPFMLAHGGQQIQIEQTQAALQKLGLTVEPLRWWDGTQDGDIFHHFNRLPISTLDLVRRKGWMVVIAALESRLAARPPLARFAIRTGRAALRKTAPGLVRQLFGWDSYRLADACIAMSPWEEHLLEGMYGVARSRLHMIPNGVEEVFLQSRPAARGPWLVCTATIIEMKQVLKLAEMAVRAQTPLWVIGKPHGEHEEYPRRFFAFARQNPKFVRYEGPVNDRAMLARIYREARGFVLLSRWEGLSLSALEASACECPLLLSDLPWARWFFRDRAAYCPATASVAESAAVLRRFYDEAPQRPLPAKPLSWRESAQRLVQVYEAVLRAR